MQTSKHVINQGADKMKHTYNSTLELIQDAARFELSAPALVKSGAYRRTASGIYIADLSKAPKCAIL
jgi:hypothetical protein